MNLEELYAERQRVVKLVKGLELEGVVEIHLAARDNICEIVLVTQGDADDSVTEVWDLVDEEFSITSPPDPDAINVGVLPIPIGVSIEEYIEDLYGDGWTIAQQGRRR